MRAHDDGTVPLPEVGTALARRLVWARILIAGAGSFRSEAGVVHAVLPGPAGYRVSIADAAQGGSRIFYRSGRALSAAMDLADESQFSAWMHNVDCCLCERNDVPSPLPVLADALVEAAVAGDRQMAAVLQGGEVSFPGHGYWRPTATAYGFAEFGRRSGVPALAAASDRMSAALDGVPQAPFDELGSLMRWGDQVERWAGFDPEIHAADDFLWKRIRTGSGIAACARRLGWLEGEVVKLFDADGSSYRDRLQALADGVAKPDLRPGTPVYAFVEDGREAGIAALIEGEVVVRGPKGQEGDYTDATDFLRGELGLGAPAWRFA